MGFLLLRAHAGRLLIFDPDAYKGGNPTIKASLWLSLKASGIMACLLPVCPEQAEKGGPPVAAGGPSFLGAMPARANPAKGEDFGDKDLLQHIGLACILFGEVIPLRRDAR